MFYLLSIWRELLNTLFMMMRVWPFVFLCFAVFSAFGADAENQPAPIAAPPEMGLPIDCEIGWNCWIMNYVDHDRSEQTKDYKCQAQSYNGHKGTDFMIRNEREMQGGMFVKAAADGMVIGARDGMRDIDFRTRDRELIRNKECGNGIRIDHGNGWITQYCHLRRNSIKVEKGNTVEAGEIIGFVGNSGWSQFPHLHFQVEYVPPQSGKRRGHIVDPFVGISRNDPCDRGADPLWPDRIVSALAYRELSIFDYGFSPSAPQEKGLNEGVYDDETLSVRSPQLFLWARLLHVEKGDRINFTVIDPAGEEVLNYTSEIERTQAYRSLHVGVRRPALNWGSGVYRGFIKVNRNLDSGGRVYRAQTTVSMK